MLKHVYENRMQGERVETRLVYIKNWIWKNGVSLRQMEVAESSLTLKHPFTAMVSGPTGSGKTVFVKRLINNIEMIEPHPEQILYFYGEWQEGFNELTGRVEFIEGVPTEMPKGDKRTLMIIDDLMTEIENSKTVSNLFTKGSHHCNCSVILLMQNFFHKGKVIRTISLNCHYLIFFKNVREKSQITSLARQIYPRNMAFLQEAYEDATRDPFSYLFMDLKPSTAEHLRVRANIFGEKGPPVVYISKASRG